MSPGIKRLQRIQFGPESTAGTKVLATARWRGMGTALDDKRKLEIIDELVGIMGGVDRTVVTQNLGGLALSAVPATPEQLQYLFVMGMAGPKTGSADGSGSDKIYTNTIPTTAGVTPTPYTVETGDDKEQEYATYGVATQVVIEGKTGETAKMSGTILTRGVARLSAGFSTTTLPAVSELPVSNGKLYLDAIGGTIGTTQVANQILGFKVQYDFMWVPKFTMDGSLDWSFAVLADYKITGNVLFEHDTAVLRNAGAKADFVSQTAKLMQIKLLGDTVTTPGTTYSQKQVLINHPIKWLNPAPLSDLNGNDTISMNWQSRYNSTYGSAGAVIVVNELAALP
jgi:hypothetical protein